MQLLVMEIVGIAQLKREGSFLSTRRRRHSLSLSIVGHVRHLPYTQGDN